MFFVAEVLRENGLRDGAEERAVIFVVEGEDGAGGLVIACERAGCRVGLRAPQ